MTRVPKPSFKSRLRALVLPVLVAMLGLALLPGVADAKKHKKKGQEIRVMTRNLYLGADLSPALAAKNLTEFTDATGAVLRQVTATNFPLRAKGLAGEILQKKPDLVGLQEVAMWRTGDTNLATLFGAQPTSTTVRYDFLQSLLTELNAKKKNLYTARVVGQEFDFDAPANEDGNPNTGFNGAEKNGRLTMRDVILVRKGTGFKVSQPTTGHFQNILTESVSGVTIPVTRGWVYVNVKTPSGKKFRLVDSHLEAFDDETQHPSIRAKQAGELVAPGGPAGIKNPPVVLIGDFNSNVPGLKPGDEQAYQTLLDAGFVERSTSNPLGCCINDSNLVANTPQDFNHQVDHIMTNDPKKIKLVKAAVTGRAQNNGLWDSDHAGLFAVLNYR